MKKTEELLGNPATGEVLISLADGKTRVCCFDIDALAMLEEAFGEDLAAIVRRRYSVTNLTGFIFCGCWRAARDSREAWTRGYVQGQLKLKGMFHLWQKVKWALDHALDCTVEKAEGES